MSIEFSYHIIAVDAAARCMEVVYSAAGRQSMHIGARLPYEGEQLEDVIRQYAPVAYWLEQERAVQVPAVGLTGTLAPLPEGTMPAPDQPVVQGAQTL